jgi:hypothetical protein
MASEIELCTEFWKCRSKKSPQIVPPLPQIALHGYWKTSFRGCGWILSLQGSLPMDYCHQFLL